MAYTVYVHKFPNGKYYVGITCQDVSRRWREGKGYEGQPVFDAILKYGWDNIEHIILETGLAKEQAENAEVEYIKKYNSLSHANGYNIVEGGNAFGNLTDEIKHKLSIGMTGRFIGEKHWHYGQHWSEEVRDKIRKAHTGKKMSLEQRERRKGMFAGEKNPMYGVKMDPEHKIKLQKACVDARSKAIVCTETGVEYKSAAEAQRKTGINSRTINYVCNGFGHYKTAGGFHWKYKE